MFNQTPCTIRDSHPLFRDYVTPLAISRRRTAGGTEQARPNNWFAYDGRGNLTADWIPGTPEQKSVGTRTSMSKPPSRGRRSKAD